MSYQTLAAKAHELSITIRAAGALGAELRLRQQGNDGDPGIRAALQEVARRLGPALLDGIDAAQSTSIIGQLTNALQEALDMIGEPERGPGWRYEDQAVLQERGRGSSAVAQWIANAARERPALAAVLERESTFLDVGTGVGWISIEAAKKWPKMRVVGIDIWEPSLKIAGANIAAEGLADRVTLRRLNLADLDDERAFDLVWLPSMFIPRELIDEALPRIANAMTPGGTLVFGMLAAGAGEDGEAVKDLLTVRWGGYPWRTEEIGDRLRGGGFVGVEAAASGPAAKIILARCP